MFHESVINVELVTERKLAPQLLVVLKGRSFRVCSKRARSAQTSWLVYPAQRCYGPLRIVEPYSIETVSREIFNHG